ncbi:MAG TPA: hypothetical protein VIG74_06010, partial [Alphaproteobacteria bacterium]
DFGGTVITKGRKEDIYVDGEYRVFVITGQKGGRGHAIIAFKKLAQEQFNAMALKANSCESGRIYPSANLRARCVAFFDETVGATTRIPFSELNDDIRDNLQKMADEAAVAEEQNIQNLIKKYSL